VEGKWRRGEMEGEIERKAEEEVGRRVEGRQGGGEAGRRVEGRQGGGWKGGREEGRGEVGRRVEK